MVTNITYEIAENLLYTIKEISTLNKNYSRDTLISLLLILKFEYRKITDFHYLTTDNEIFYRIHFTNDITHLLIHDFKTRINNQFYFKFTLDDIGKCEEFLKNEFSHEYRKHKIKKIKLWEIH